MIAGLVKSHGLNLGAEVGVAEGRFSDAILSLCPDLTLWAIDNFAPGYLTWMGTTWTEGQQKANRAAFSRVLAKYGERLTLAEMPSQAAANRFDDASLDFVFVDADHGYEAVKADIAAWRPKVRLGGFLTGHDYHEERFPGVVQAVDETLPDATLADDHVWIHAI